VQIEIVVVDYEDELWFEFEGLKFDTLDAFWELDRRELRAVRNGVVIATGRVHEARGDVVFDDYGAGRLQGSALHAEKFRLADHLVLDIPDGFSLANYLIESCQSLGAVIASMPVGQKMSLDDAKRRVVAELHHNSPSLVQVLRFRRDR
jgi:hypothetical protein